MKNFGSNGGLQVNDKVDEDRDLYVRMDDSDCETWLSETEARNLIAHLQMVFELNRQNGLVE